MLGSLSLPASTLTDVAGFLNLGVAKNTWSTYRTAQRMLHECQKKSGVSIELPISTSDTVRFIHYLAKTRGLKGATIRGYLAGLRQLHIARGIDPPQALRSELVKQMLRGLTNSDGMAKRTGEHRGRLPITTGVMLLIKQLTRDTDWDNQKKLLFWAICTIAFAGAFRVHELLTKSPREFDPRFTLLTEDVQTTGNLSDRTGALHFKLKSPKETRSANPVIIDVLQGEGHLCPVKAFRKWEKARKPKSGSPLFSDAQGVLFTSGDLNAALKTLLSPYTDPSIGTFSSHSFRIGLATTLGSLGHSDAEVKAAGRWSSRAFEMYMKLPRGRRSDISRGISNL
jgi:hypothetical protein